MHNLPIFILVLAVILSAAAFLAQTRVVRSLASKMLPILRPIEDQWIFKTRDGKVFEEVDVKGIENGEVIFSHRLGDERIPLADLSEESLEKLEAGFKDASQQSKVPGKRSDSDTDYKKAA